MKIEILYLSDCSHHAPTVSRVREVLRQENVAADVTEIEINDDANAHHLGFLGSPSVRVDGQDIEHDARSSAAFGLTCRTYNDRGTRMGVPPREWLRAAIHEVQTGTRDAY